MYLFISRALFVMKITKKLLEKNYTNSQSDFATECFLQHQQYSILFHAPRPQFFSPYYSTYVYISLYNLAFSYLHISYAFKVLHFQVTCLCYFLGLHIYFLIHERRRNTRGMMMLYQSKSRLEADFIYGGCFEAAAEYTIPAIQGGSSLYRKNLCYCFPELLLYVLVKPNVSSSYDIAGEKWKTSAIDIRVVLSNYYFKILIG